MIDVASKILFSSIMLEILPKKHPSFDLLSQPIEQPASCCQRRHRCRPPSSFLHWTAVNRILNPTIPKPIYEQAKPTANRVGSSFQMRLTTFRHHEYPPPGIYCKSSGPVLIGAHTGLKGRKSKQGDHGFHGFQRQQFLNFFRRQVKSNPKCHKAKAQQLKAKQLIGSISSLHSRPPYVSQQGRQASLKSRGLTLRSKPRLKDKKLGLGIEKNIDDCLRIKDGMIEANQGLGPCQQTLEVIQKILLAIKLRKVVGQLMANNRKCQSSIQDIQSAGQATCARFPGQSIRDLAYPALIHPEFKQGQPQVWHKPLESNQEGWEMQESLGIHSLRIVGRCTSGRAPLGLSVSMLEKPDQLQPLGCEGDPNEPLNREMLPVPLAVAGKSRQQSSCVQTCQPIQGIMKWSSCQSSISQSRVLVDTDLPNCPQAKPFKASDNYNGQPLQAHSFENPAINTTIPADLNLANFSICEAASKGKQFPEFLQQIGNEENLYDSLLQSVPMIRTLESRKHIIDQEFHGSRLVCIQDMSVITSSLGVQREPFAREPEEKDIQKRDKLQE